jgi:monoamine oxidase
VQQSQSAWTRRQFIGSLGLGAVGILSCGRNRQPDVIVIGAGISGLAAALCIRDAGFRVSILEAANRAGGRIRTIRDKMPDRAFFEAGAMQIAASHSHVLDLVDRYGLEILERPKSPGSALIFRGKILEPSRPAGDVIQGLSSIERSLSVTALRSRYLVMALRDIDADLEHASSPTAAELDAISFGALLQRHGATPAALSLIRLGFLDSHGDGVESVSALSVVREFRAQRLAGEYFLLAGGSDTLPSAIANELAADVRYRCWARRVDQTDHGSLEVTSESNGVRRRHTCRAVIVAVPATQIRRMAFGMQISEAKQRAINGLRHTSICRVFTALNRRMLDTRGLGTVSTDGEAMLIRNASRGLAGDKIEILEAFVTGHTARELGTISLRDQIKRISGDLELALPGAMQSLAGSWSIAWDNDPYSLGDYPWFAPGEHQRFETALRTPERNVYFAGEQASDKPGWMEGAVTAGARAAVEAIASL